MKTSEDHTHNDDKFIYKTAVKHQYQYHMSHTLSFPSLLVRRFNLVAVYEVPLIAHN